MNTAEQREKNREKQKRFRESHPGYYERLRKKREERQRLTNPRLLLPSIFRTFELCDPRDPEKLPVIVGYCRSTIKPVWANLWAVRHFSKAKWALWMRELDALGMEPEERESPWNVGVNFQVTKTVADFAVRMRLHRINMIMTGDANTPPDFLLRYLMDQRQYPVGYVVSGEEFHFPSIKAASLATGVHTRMIKQFVLETHTSENRMWFDD